MSDRLTLLAEALLAGIWPVRFGCLQWFDDRQLAALIERGETVKPGGDMANKAKRPGSVSEPKTKPKAKQTRSATMPSAPQRAVMWLINTDWKEGDKTIDSLVNRATWQPFGTVDSTRQYREYQSLATFSTIESAEKFAAMLEQWLTKLHSDGLITGGCITTCEVGKEAETLKMDDAELAARDAASEAAQKKLDEEAEEEEEE